MIKEAYTKEELKFIDNCSLALGENRIFSNVVGHILTIDSIDNKRTVEQFKSYLFELNLEDFEDVKNKFVELLIASKKTKYLYKQLVGMCGKNPDEF